MTALRSRRGSRGFTLLEILIVTTLTGLVVAGMLKALTAQKRYYARQARILDARHALRASTTILTSELREASARDGDIYFVAPDSVGFRSTVAFGVVCAIDGTTLALTRTSGHFELVGADSLLAFSEDTFRDDDDAWRAFGITSLGTSGLTCVSGAPAERVVGIDGDASDLWVGAPVRLFRPYIYGLFESADGRWWLGRRLRTASEHVPVAGPLAPPGDRGLRLTYWDNDGSTAATIPEIARIGIEVRAPTYRSADDPAYRDLITSAFLRNDG